MGTHDQCKGGPRTHFSWIGPTLTIMSGKKQKQKEIFVVVFSVFKRNSWNLKDDLPSISSLEDRLKDVTVNVEFNKDQGKSENSLWKNNI